MTAVKKMRKTKKHNQNSLLRPGMSLKEHDDLSRRLIAGLEQLHTRGAARSMTDLKDTKAPDPSNSTVFEAERYMVELADDLCDWMRERGAPARLALGAVLTAAGKIIGGVFSESEKDLAEECGAADYFIKAEAEQAFEAWKSKSTH